MIGHLLSAEGFTTATDIVQTDLDEMLQIEGFDEDLATEIKNRAAVYVTEKEKEIAEALKKLKVEDALMNLNGMTSQVLVKLAKNKIVKLDDFADLASDELIDMVGDDLLTVDEANELIMNARAHWFEADAS